MCKETFPGGGGGEGGVKRNFRGRMCRDISGGGGMCIETFPGEDV